MSDQGSVYTCKNHPNMRWWDTKPNGNLIFGGEIVRIPETGHKVRKEPAYESGNPLLRLRQYANNKNPYAPSLELDPPITWERIVGYVKYVEKVTEMGNVFECECPASDLQKLAHETYDTLYALPKWEKPSDAPAA